MALTLRLASLALASIVMLAPPARAADDLPPADDAVQVGTSLVCDTQQQAEHFARVYDGDAETAASTVNAEERDPSACVLGTMIYVQGPPLATITHNNTTFHIVTVVVVGVVTEDGIQAVEPARYFSAQQIEGYPI